MGSCCGKPKTIEQHPPRSNPGDYPRNPAYANVPQNVLCNPQPVPVLGAYGNMGVVSGAALASGTGGGSMEEGLALGYMMGHGGGAGMLSGIDGGPRMAIGGNYY